MNKVISLWQHKSVQYATVSVVSVVGYALLSRVFQAVKDRVTPLRFMSDLHGYRHTMIVKAAIEYEIFTVIGELEKQNHSTISAIAKRINCPEKGTRILLDALCVREYLTKKRVGSEFSYYNTPMADKFLNKNNKQTYFGCLCEFILADSFLQKQANIVQAIKNNGSPFDSSLMTANNEEWVKFAKAMQPMARHTAQFVYKLVSKHIHIDETRPINVLDISCSHAEFGLAFAKHSKTVKVYGIDWPNVLEIGVENATILGLKDQFVPVSGDALAMEKYGEPSTFDVVLVPNFLHHFSVEVNVKTLRKCYDLLKQNGVLAIVEFVPNEDRTSKPEAVLFSVNMLVGTEHGDAYTYNQLRDMVEQAGFKNSKLHMASSGPMPQSVLSITKQ
jgi:ubiquinone/menaquinone biosynthesis C-methylase UbiE